MDGNTQVNSLSDMFCYAAAKATEWIGLDKLSYLYNACALCSAFAGDTPTYRQGMEIAAALS